VMAAGVAPRAELAAAAGISVGGGAIPVDAAMRTSAPGVLAAGDVCRAFNVAAGRELRVEHWGDALGQGAIAGQVAAGREAAWSDVPGFWSTIGRCTLKYTAWGDGFDEARFVPHGNGFTVCYGRDGKLVGVLTHEADENYERGGQAVAEGAPWRR
jgi:3-phenylpropionate/trans-cinnamate dioxygenase ferredoxin reductase component